MVRVDPNPQPTVLVDYTARQKSPAFYLTVGELASGTRPPPSVSLCQKFRAKEN